VGAAEVEAEAEVGAEVEVGAEAEEAAEAGNVALEEQAYLQPYVIRPAALRDPPCNPT
jgi:hypothetical protein